MYIHVATITLKFAHVGGGGYEFTSTPGQKSEVIQTNCSCGWMGGGGGGGGVYGY